MKKKPKPTPAPTASTLLMAAVWVTGEATIKREQICPGRIQSGGRRGKGLSYDIVLKFRGHKLAVLEAKQAGVSHMIYDLWNSGC